MLDSSPLVSAARPRKPKLTSSDVGVGYFYNKAHRLVAGGEGLGAIVFRRNLGSLNAGGVSWLVRPRKANLA